MKENSIRRAVREGRAALGTGLKEFASRGVPRIIESSGFDYCMIDMEHGAFDLETIADLAAWFAAGAYLSVKVLTRTDPPLSIVWWFSVIGTLAASGSWLDGVTRATPTQWAVPQ